MGLAAPWHVESSQTRDRTHVPCIGRQSSYPLCHEGSPQSHHFCSDGLSCLSNHFLHKSDCLLRLPPKLCTCTTWFYSPLHLPQPPTTFRVHLSTQAVITSPPLDLPSQLCNLIPRAPLPATANSLSPPPCPNHSTSLHCFYALKCYMKEL